MFSHTVQGSALPAGNARNRRASRSASESPIVSVVRPRRSPPRGLAAFTLAVLTACFEAPTYDGRTCSADEPCPVELVCDADARCRTPCADDDACAGDPALTCAPDGRCRLGCTGVEDCGEDETCTGAVCTPSR